MSTHRHKFSVSGWTGSDVIVFRCRCGTERQRKMTREEKSQYRRERAEMFKPARKDDLHAVFKDFVKRFRNKDETWRFVGYDLMQRVENWAKKYPTGVWVLSCDDNYFSSSVLILIEHRTKNRYMGTTVVYIPQCAGEQPIRFFLYPDHRDSLIAALTQIKFEAAPIQKREKKIEAEQVRYWSKVKP